MRFLVGLIAAALVLTGCGAAAPTPPSPVPAAASMGRTLDVEQFEALVGRPGVVILDVRTAEEYAEGHLPDAINIDVEGPDFERQVDGLDRSKTYAVYCRTGQRSAVAVAELRAMGFRDVQHLAGGIVNWRSAGKPIVR